MHSALESLSPLDGRYADELAPLRPFFSEQGLVSMRIRVELRYLRALVAALQIPVAPATLDTLIELENDPRLPARVKAHEAVTRHDVKAVEYALADALRDAGHAELINWLHWGLTSEDVNNLAYGLMISESYTQVILPALNQLLTLLQGWIAETAALPMLARTHGQAASPTTVGKEFAVFASRLLQELQHLDQLLPVGGKLNGATGNWHLFQMFFPEMDWPGFSTDLIGSLGLKPEMLSTQIVTRESYARVLDATRRINQILLDMARDTWYYISIGYFRLRRRSEGEVGSSTMPHKINPVMFENAEGNLELASHLLELFSSKLLKSRLQRDLSDSTVLRNLGVALGHSLLAWQNLAKGLRQLEPDKERLAHELEEHWEVLAEPLQHALRLQGREVPYDLIRQHTQGLRLDRAGWQALLAQLQIDLPIASPAAYTGLAPQLAHQVYLAIQQYQHTGNPLP
ncbi:MAG: adenylosuccinate lyase [Candidatus Sericytochromatia bacterium]